MKDRNNICIYFHINIITRKIFYIGIGNKYRPYDKRQRNQFWLNTVNKYGYEVFIKSINLSWIEACRREIIYIKRFGRRDLGLGNLVNLTDGGDGCYGKIQSPESIKKSADARRGLKRNAKFSKRMSEIHSGKTISDKQRKQISEFHTGKKHSEETKRKISKSNMGKKMPIESIRKMVEARRYYRHSADTILKIRNSSIKKAVLQYDKSNNFIDSYMSLAEAERITGIYYTNIRACCNNKRKSAGGFMWKFKQAGK